MYEFFVKLLNMSLTAGILVLVIMLLRFVLKKAPRKYICMLWFLVALRLVCPVGIPSALSLFNFIDIGNNSSGQVDYFSYNEENDKPAVNFQVPVLVNDDLSVESVTVGMHTSDINLPILMWIWFFGVLALLAYAVGSYIYLRKKIAASICRENQIYVCDDIKSPFILGIIRPNIYLPSGLDSQTEKYVIAHEMSHIRRRDHWWKPFGYILLTVYWFNPLFWIAYVLLCRDIEAACDEKVIHTMDKNSIIGYSEALLSCASARKRITVCPVAFGEDNVKGRVKNVLNYKKPAFFVGLITVLICLVATICLLTNAKSDSEFTIKLVNPAHSEENSPAKEVMQKFFARFEEADYDGMAKFCTDSCRDRFFHESDVFGYKRAAVTEYTEMTIDEGTYKYQVKVQVETTPQSALYPATETIFSVWLINVDGEWWVNDFSTD